MKKLLTLVVVLLFASNFFAQEMRDIDPKTYKEVLKQMLDEVKSSDVKARGMNEILYNKKKELGKLRSDRAQIPHGPSDNDAVIWEEDMEGVVPWFGLNFGASTGGEVQMTTFNAPGAVGNQVWWFGDNDPSFLQPGYGAGWGIYLQHNQISYQLQGGLTTANVRFDGFYNIEEGWDAVHLQVSVDSGATWDWVECWSGDTGGQWVNNITVNLEDYIGEYITFRFVLISDGAFDSEDGEIGSIDNPGGFFIENLYVVRNGVPELVTDGGDTKVGMFSGNYAPPFLWEVTDEQSESGDWSLGHAVDGTYLPGIAYWAGFDVDVTPPALGGNVSAPLWLDFNVYSTMPGAAADGGFDYWAPYIVNWSTSPVSIALLGGFVYTGAFGDDGDFVSFADNFGYVDITEYIGDDISIGILFASNGGCDFGPGSVFVDDFVVIQKNDPYEYNDDPDTASLIEYGFVSEFANIFPAGETDWWYFEGEAGDWIDVYVDNSNVDTYLELYTSTGAYVPSQFVAWDDMAAYDRIIFRLPQTSGYLLNLTDQGPGQGAYTMYLDKLQAEANIMMIEDVAGDQGKKVRVQFDGSELDQLSGANAFDFGRWGAEAVGYQIERRKSIISNDWDNVAQLDAFGNPGDGYNYRVEVPTLFDSASATFRVKTKIGLGDYNAMGYFVPLATYFGTTGTGESYDNIAPKFDLEYTAAAESGVGVDIGAEVDYGGGNDGISDLAFYNIYRADESGFTPSSSNLIATLETNATSVRYNDADYDGNTEFYYVIEVVDDGGNKVYSKEVNTTTDVADEAMPTVYSLAQNYPNPFNPSTTIKFGLPQASDVTIKIFDILGQEVRTLVNRNMTAGFHTVNFDASNLMSGMYIYRVQANGVDGKDFTDVKKMLLVK